MGHERADRSGGAMVRGDTKISFPSNHAAAGLRTRRGRGWRDLVALWNWAWAGVVVTRGRNEGGFGG